MINKLTKVLFTTLVMIAIVPVCVMASSSLIAKLNSIEADINELKAEYNNIITTHADVINSLSAESKETLNNLSSNILADDIGAKVDAVKAELANSSVAGATDVLNAIDDLETDAKALIDENKDIVNDLKSDYENLSVEEAKQVIEKVQDIMESVGATPDTTDTYNEMMSIINDAHAMALGINTKLETLLQNNVSTFEEALTLDLVEDLITAVDNKDREAAIDILIDALNNVSGAEALKQELRAIKSDAVNLKNKLMEVNNLDEQDVVMFNDNQIKGISDKLKLIEKDYIDFAKVLINNYLEVYLDIVFDVTKDINIDKMIEYANKGLDIIADRENIINDLKNNQDIKNKLPKELISKAGIMVALGIVDFSDYNRDYVESNFSAEIENIASYVLDKMLEYLDHIDYTMKDEVKNLILKEATPDLAQTKIREINMNRFNTLSELKKLKDRVDSELLSEHARVKEELAKYAPRVYDIFNTNILDTIETIMSLENEKASRVYEYNSVYSYILTDTFIAGAEFIDKIGIPTANQNVAAYTNLINGTVKTGSKLDIVLSDSVYQAYSFAVLGDVYADGMIDARDYMAIKNQIMDKAVLGDINKIAANTYRDSLIDARDYMVIKNEIMDDVNKEITLGGN